MHRAGALPLGSAGLFVLALCCLPAHAAGDGPPPLSLGAGRFYTTEGREVVFARFDFVADSARYQLRPQSPPTLVPASSVLRVERETGSRSHRGLVVGGLMGLTVGFGVVCAAHGLSKLDPLGWLAALGRSGGGGGDSSGGRFNWGLASGVAAGGCVVGAGIGYHYGSGFKTYTRAYDDPSLRRP